MLIQISFFLLAKAAHMLPYFQDNAVPITTTVCLLRLVMSKERIELFMQIAKFMLPKYPCT